jgi:phage N-6-adenine-methyltransferase
MQGYTQLMSSQTDNWSTPQPLFEALNAEFMFTVDVCASDVNHKCPEYFTKADDGLSKEWAGVCWMNPPYGKTIGRWIEKAYLSSQNGATVVCLLPARTDTKWFHAYCLRGELRWIKGRLKFGDSKNTATFPSFLCIFRGANKED